MFVMPQIPPEHSSIMHNLGDNPEGMAAASDAWSKQPMYVSFIHSFILQGFPP